MADQYTHDFVYRIGDGSSFILGEMELHKDKKVSYRIKKWSEPMEHTFLDNFTQFIDRAKLRFDETGGLRYVVIKEKGYKDNDAKDFLGIE